MKNDHCMQSHILTCVKVQLSPNMARPRVHWSVTIHLKRERKKMHKKTKIRKVTKGPCSEFCCEAKFTFNDFGQNVNIFTTN